MRPEPFTETLECALDEMVFDTEIAVDAFARSCREWSIDTA
jgi:hypothetical protein